MRRTLLLLAASACAAAAVWGLAGGAPAQQTGRAPSADRALVAQGRTLYAETCSSCHGFDARGRPGRGPSLYGAGAQAADFYLSTGRMPLADPDDAPVRTKPQLSRAQIAALTAYVGSLGGPPIPSVDPARGDLAEGLRAFTEDCAGCHQVVGRGGVVVGGIAPPLQQATPTQVAEAIRIGPYLMPRFTMVQVDQQRLDAIVRYVAWTKHPDDRGGWGIGNIGPIPEGMVAWLLGLAALLLVASLIGERMRS
jgi:ubiquinol-cytochrome c reductase cytochrome c subunit